MTQDDINLIYEYLTKRFDYREDGILIDKKNKTIWYGHQTRRSKNLFFEVTVRIKGKKYHMSYGHAIYIYHHRLKPDYLEYLNGNTVDCRIENLKAVNMTKRILNLADNSRNKHGYRGVIQDNNRFGARIMTSGKYRYISWHDTPEEAHQSYLSEKKKLLK